MSDNSLAILTNATRMLAEVRSAPDAKHLMDLASAAKHYAKKTGLGKEAVQYANTIKIDAQTMLGGFLTTAEKNKGAVPNRNSVEKPPTLEDLNIDRKESSDAQWLFRAKTEKPEVHAAVRDGELSVHQARTAPHVSKNSGKNEWYTPPEYIQAATAVLGVIDCDPASSKKANAVVVATQFWTDRDDGLKQKWGKRVWMNPPYAQPLCGQFCSELARRVKGGEVKEAISLTNNATETVWFVELISQASAVVFPYSRIKFLDPKGNPGAPLQGQACVYFGANTVKFLQEFSQLGWGALIHK